MSAFAFRDVDDSVRGANLGDQPAKVLRVCSRFDDHRRNPGATPRTRARAPAIRRVHYGGACSVDRGIAVHPRTATNTARLLPPSCCLLVIAFPPADGHGPPARWNAGTPVCRVNIVKNTQETSDFPDSVDLGRGVECAPVHTMEGSCDTVARGGHRAAAGVERRR